MTAKRNSVPDIRSKSAQSLPHQIHCSKLALLHDNQTKWNRPSSKPGLHLSSDETHEREKEQEASRTAYRRKYWQGYAKKIKRIFGTVSPEDYAAVKSRADETGRSVWGQVWAEAQAYHHGNKLASGEIADQQRQLIAELRRIGNNLNQLARLGHIQNRKHGSIEPSEDAITTEAMQQLALLEEAVTKFDDGGTIRVQYQD